MRILILHRIPYQEIGYGEVINHAVHDVVYIGTEAALDDLPVTLRCQKRVRAGSKRSVCAEVLDLVQGERFDRVVSLSEFELLDAAHIREHVGADGPRTARAELWRNKIKMKSTVRAAGLRVPAFVPCSELEVGRGSLSWHGKTILKPVDGACSRDTQVFGCAEEAVAAVRSGKLRVIGFSPERFELEEFVEGHVIHIDGLLVDAKPFSVVASQYEGTCLRYAHEGLPLGSVELAHSDKQVAFAAACARAVGIRNGAFHLEAITTPDGPCFVEIGARVGAASVVDVVALVTGIQLNQAALSLEVFGQADLSPLQTHRRRHGCYGWFVFGGHHIAPGKLRIEDAEPFARDEHVLQWRQLSNGHPLSPTISYAPEDCPITGVLQGMNTDEVRKFLHSMFADIRIECA